MISLLLFAIAIGSVCVFGALVCQKKFGYMFPIGTALVIIVLLIFGFFNRLHLGVYAVLIYSITLMIVSILVLIKNKNIARLRLLFNPVCFIMCTAGAGLAYLHNARLCSGFDEFTHWATVVKSMTIIYDFSANRASGLLYQNYPPSMSLFQYFLEVLAIDFQGIEFSEWRLFFAYQILQWSFFCPILELAMEKKTGKKAIIPVLCLSFIVVPAFFYENYLTSIYIDQFIAILYACCAGDILLNPNRDVTFWMRVSFGMVVIGLAKVTGILFAASIAILSIVDTLSCFRTFDADKKIRAIWGYLRKPIIAMIPIGVFKFLWNRELVIEHSNVSLNSVDVSKFLLDAFQRGENYSKEVLKKYGDKIFSNEFVFGTTGINLSYFSLFIIAAILLALFLKKLRNPRGDWWVLIGTSFVYILGLAATYATSWDTEGYGATLPSFDRYYFISLCGIYLIALILFLFVSQWERYAIVLAVSLICITDQNELMDFFSRQSVIVSRDFRRAVDDLVVRIDEIIPAGRVLFACDRLQDGWMINFDSMYFNGKRVASYNTSTNFEEYMVDGTFSESFYDNYDYVVFSGLSDGFKSKYKTYVEDEDLRSYSLYEVDKTSGNISFIMDFSKK